MIKYPFQPYWKAANGSADSAKMWHGIVYLNHGMWVGQWAPCLLQDPFKQSKLSLKLTLTMGNCKTVVTVLIIIWTLEHRA